MGGPYRHEGRHHGAVQPAVQGHARAGGAGGEDNDFVMASFSVGQHRDALHSHAACHVTGGGFYSPARCIHVVHSRLAMLHSFTCCRRLPRVTRRARPACSIQLLPRCIHTVQVATLCFMAAGDHHSGRDGCPMPVAFACCHVAFTPCHVPFIHLLQEITTRDETGAPCARGMRTTPFGQYVADGPPTCLSGELFAALQTGKPGVCLQG